MALEYRIIEADCADALQLKVQKQIGLGWEPQGGMCFWLPLGDYGSAYTQAMVRKVVEEPTQENCYD